MNRCSNHQQCIADALAQAEQLCRERGVRLTPLRRQVLEAIWRSHEAVKAYALMHALSSEDHTIKPPTIYRSLEFLLEQGLIHRIESLNAYVGCDHPADRHEPQLLICDRCGHVQEVAAPDTHQALDTAARAVDFHIDRRTVEVHGLCRRCSEDGGKPKDPD